MTTQYERHLRAGSDPQTLVDYAVLRDEMSKPAGKAAPPAHGITGWATPACGSANPDRTTSSAVVCKLCSAEVREAS